MCVHSCGGGYNKELLASRGGLEETHLPDCPHISHRECNLEQVKGIEVSKSLPKLIQRSF